MDVTKSAASCGTSSPETNKPLQSPPNVPDAIFSPPPPPPPPTDATTPPGPSDFSLVAGTFPNTETLHEPDSPCDSDEKPGVAKLPSVHELETQSDQASESSGFLRQHLECRPIRLALTFASPLSGLLALLFGVLHIVACFAILYASDHTPVARWPYAPQVYLAILTAISNKALAFAAVQGTVVTWWLKAMRGTTLAQLHWDWAAGLHVWQAIAAGRHFSVLAFACLCATFVAIDGPLLQSASSTRPEVPGEPVTMSVSMAPEMPAYFSGWSEYPASNGTGSSDTANDFLPVLKAYSSGIPMRDFISGCEGTCTATIRAPALSLVECDELIRDVNYTAPLTDREMELLTETGRVGDNRTAFLIAGGVRPDVRDDEREILLVQTIMSDDAVANTCVGEIKDTACEFLSAIGEYPIQIQDGVITFLEAPSRPRIIAIANNTAVTPETIMQHGLMYPAGGWVRTTLGGISASHLIEYSLNNGLVPLVAGDTPALTNNNALTFEHVENWEEFSSGAACAPLWRDPLDDVLALLNELMFRAGFYTAQRYDASWFQNRLDPGLDVHHNVTGIPVSTVNVFVTDYRYFAGAAVLEIITILAILFTFYGWWRLDPERSLSPLEIAKAFDSPLLNDFESDQKGSKMAKIGCQRQVRYGIVQDHEAGGVMKRAFADL